MIDISYMGNIRPELADHRSDLSSRLCGIDRVRRLPRFCPPSRFSLEISVWNEMSVIRGWVSPRIGHRKKRGLVAVLSHQLNEFKEMYFGAAERIVIFIAIQDSHQESPRTSQVSAEIHLRTVSHSCCD